MKNVEEPRTDRPAVHATPDGVAAQHGNRMRALAQKTSIIYGIGALFALLMAALWFAGQVFLLAFAAILVAILLYDSSVHLEQWLGLPRRLVLALMLPIALGSTILAGWFLVPRISEQTSQLITQVQATLDHLRSYMEQHQLFRQLVNTLPEPEKMAGGASSVAAHASSVFSNLLGGLADILIALFVAIYLAANPGVYTRGMIKLLPQRARPRAWCVLHELRRVLALWLLGKLLSMAAIGVATAVGLSLLGVPFALALGILAGVLDFIPYIGSILASVPAILIAFAQSPIHAVYVIVLFLGIHALDGYILLPLVERRTVALPPALTISMQALMGLAFGLPGIALATPLTAVFEVLITMLYIQDLLHDDATLPGK